MSVNNYIYLIDRQNNIIRINYCAIIRLYRMERELCLSCVLCESCTVQNGSGYGRALRTTHVHSETHSVCHISYISYITQSLTKLNALPLPWHHAFCSSFNLLAPELLFFF